MTKTVCDRCGKVLCTEKLPKATTEWTVVDIRPRLCAEFTPHFAVYDLCEDCKDALVAFIKGEEGRYKLGRPEEDK